MKKSLCFSIVTTVLFSLTDMTHSAEKSGGESDAEKHVGAKSNVDNLMESLSSLTIQPPQGVKTVRADTAPQIEVKVVPNAFKTINLKVQFKGGTAVVRPLVIRDINQIFIDRMCAHDPSDPMDSSDPNDPLPSVDEVQKMYSELLLQPNQIVYGIFNCEDQIMGTTSILEGRYFFNALESTIRIHPAFRGGGLGTSVMKGLFIAVQEAVAQIPDCPILYLEGSINGDNIGSQKASLNAGMVRFQDLFLYYCPLRKRLGLPVRIPKKQEDQSVAAPVIGSSEAQVIKETP
jgi:RimJ/RimL family protein N-acetyltransferase